MEQNPQTQQPSQFTPPPKNWLVEAILVTLFCCLPFGVVGIVFAAQVNSKFASGDINGAMLASKDAGKWTKIGFFAGLAGVVIYLALVFLFGVTAFWAVRHNYNDF